MKDFVKEKYDEGITKPNALLHVLVMRLRKMKEPKKNTTQRILANDPKLEN